jgi:hypothetical protein
MRMIHFLLGIMEVLVVVMRLVTMKVIITVIWKTLALLLLSLVRCVFLNIYPALDMFL